ncbi:MAG: SGNH/GDSL hydrolase family protein [Verrucomicrobiales bacterium]|jgi:lysophospholipase L1-like esterase|nr:SGNH/GDSL hydrolase family protein [Verrucomicrobiales bacterium]
MKIAKNSKLVLIGDSITDGGRARPVGEGGGGALGAIYPSKVHGLLGAVYPEYKIRVVNMGCGGNTVRDLQARWQTDVLDLQPDWLGVMIGINDVWRQFDRPLQREIHVPLPEYRATLEELVRTTRPRLRGLVLLSPYLIEPNRREPMRRMMDEYGAAVRELAAKYDAIFVDVQAEFDRLLQHLHPMSIAWDRVHPDVVGETLIARAFLRAVDFEF